MRKIINLIARVLVWVLIIAMPILAIGFACGYNIAIVHGDSMYPVLHDKDIVITEKSFVPERNDIITLTVKDDTFYIKRVIGLPGETVQIIDGYVYINGEKYADVVDIQMEDAGLFTEPQIIPEDHYFVLGDNRNHSIDSRALGLMHKDDITGRVIRHWGNGDISLNT